MRKAPGWVRDDRLHPRHAVWRLGVDHAAQITAFLEQALQILEADLVVAGAGAVSVILNGDGDERRQLDPERGKRCGQSFEVDIGGLDDDRVWWGIGTNFDTHGAHASQIVVQGAGGVFGRGEGQSSGEVVLHGVGRSAAAHQDASEMNRASRGRRRAHALSHDLRLRRQHELQAVLGFPSWVEEQHILRAGPDVYGEDRTDSRGVELKQRVVVHRGECIPSW